jgi:large subunit ribosomal protein L21
MSYAIISLGGKQYRVSEGQRLLVDRLATEDGKTFTPDVLLVGGDGAASLSPKDVTVTVKVVGRQRGPKIRIGKYKKRTGYKRHTGFRASLTQIEIESIGGAKKAPAKKAKAEPEAAPKAEAAPTTEEAPTADERVKGMPAGYEDMTVAEIKAASSDWNRPMLEAALEYERAHAERKGAIAALEAALAEKEGA